MDALDEVAVVKQHRARRLLGPAAMGRGIDAPRHEQARANQRALARVRIHARPGECAQLPRHERLASVIQAQPIVDAWRGVIRAFACHLGTSLWPGGTHARPICVGYFVAAKLRGETTTLHAIWPSASTSFDALRLRRRRQGK
jgi:hypothetical protein